MTERTPNNLIGCTSEEMGGLACIREEPPYRARELASWIYRRGARDFSEMTSLSKDLRSRLAEIYSIERPRIAATRESVDGETRKHLFSLRDGLQIEAVEMREPRRDTICVSSQAGCAYGCRFCATGLMGFARDLRPDEILGQILAIRDSLRARDGSGYFNLVFMGMGEPLANYEVLLRCLRVLNEDFGLGIGRRRITISTVGLVPQIEKLAREASPPRLALSLNATTDDVRSELMPINRRHPIDRVLTAVARYRSHTGCRTTLEYVLIRAVNDSIEDADRLAAFARRTGCTVNLIPYNPHPGSLYRAPDGARVEIFRDRMLPQAPTVTVRLSKGGDIQAACGQLATAARAGHEATDPDGDSGCNGCA